MNPTDVVYRGYLKLFSDRYLYPLFMNIVDVKVTIDGNASTSALLPLRKNNNICFPESLKTRVPGGLSKPYLLLFLKA